MDGEGKIICNGKEYAIVKGDTYFIPAELEIEIMGKVEILKSFM